MIRSLSSIVLLSLVSCGDDGVAGIVDSCRVVDLPLTGESNAPVITDVALEAQQGDGIIVLATATDPQGDENLQNVPQIIRLFQDATCELSPIVLQDDLVGSGVEESFGSAVPRTDPLFNTIAAAQRWPVEVEFRDADDNLTSGRVLARVIADIGGVRSTHP